MANLIWVFCINYTIFGFIGFIANLIILLRLYRTRKENSIFNKTLASLSSANVASDICFIVTGGLFASHFMQHKTSMETNAALDVLQYANRYATCISFFHILFITVQRLAAISFPFRFKRIFTTRVVCIILVFIWIAGVAIVSLYHFIFKISADPDIPMSLSIIVIGVVFLISYAWIFYRLLKSERLSRQLTNTRSNEIQSDTSNNVKIFINSFGITLLFVISMFPYAILVLSGSSQPKLRIIFSSFLVIKTICDPLAYFFIARCKFIQRRKESEHPKPSVISHSENTRNFKRELTI